MIVKVSGVGRVTTQPMEQLPERSNYTYSTGNVSVMVVGYSLDVVDAFNKYP